MTLKKRDLELLLAESKAMLSTNPREALRMAKNLEGEVGSRNQKLLCGVLRTLGRARQLCGDLDQARSTFQRAASVASSRLEHGHVLCQWSLLEVDCRRHDLARHIVALGLAYIEHAEPSNRDLARGLIVRAVVDIHGGRHDRAERDLRRVLQLIHPRRDRDLHYAAMQNLSISLMSGKRDPARIAKALRTLEATNRVLRRYRIRLKSIQNGSLLHAKALAYRLIGSEERAMTLLNRSREIFMDLGAHTDWLRASLDLLEIHMHYHHWGHVKRMLAEMLDHTNDLETFAALGLFYDAITAEAVAVTEEIVRTVYARIHGKARRPPLVSAPPVDTSEPLGW